ncbi:MAG: hypothetical protein Tsb0017_22760 [Geothermobacteraceae bacterium]
MKTMVKVLIALVVIVAAVVAGTLFYVDTLAKKAIEYGGTEALGVATRLDKISLSFLGGKADLNQLVIDNPRGFSSDRFFVLGEGRVAVSPGSLLEDTIVIPDIRLAHIRMNLEQKDKSNNIEPLLARARAAGGAGSSQGSAGKADEAGKKLVVDRFVIEDVQVAAQLAFLGDSSKVNLVLPRIELKNLGRDKGGMTMPELIQTVIQTLLDAAARSSGDLSPQLAALLRGQLKGLDTIKGELVGKAQAEVEGAVKKVQEQIGGQVQEQLKKVPVPAGVDQKVQQETGKALEGVKGLFGGKK